MKTQVWDKKLHAVREFAAAALFTGAAIFYYHATMPEPTAHEKATQGAFVDANPIRLHWLTAAYKSNTAPAAVDAAAPVQQKNATLELKAPKPR